jgi:hypothetical protein
MEADDPIQLGLTREFHEGDIDALRAEIAETQSTRRARFAGKFFLAALSSIPWIGGYLSAMINLRTDEAAVRQNDLQTEWLEEHHGKLQNLEGTLSEIDSRFEAIGESINERIESEEYLGIVRKAFRVWDTADTEEKRNYVANLVTNAGGTRLCSDDVLRLFTDWLALYHESHFAVIREISKNPGSTRQDVWTALYDIDVREDSAEADLFKLLFRDLSTGGVIRQERDTNQLGQFVRKASVRSPKGFAPRTMKSAFDDKEAYVLTAMGKQFVHYTMNEVVVRISSGLQGEQNPI